MNTEQNIKYISIVLMLFTMSLRVCDTEHKVDSIDLKLNQCIAAQGK